MPKYIDVENYCKTICRCNGEACDKNKCPIWNAPTADVEPVRHGRWIDIGNSDETEGMWECSECGYQTHHEFALIDEIQECGSMIRCEHCGAKMDGESEERK